MFSRKLKYARKRLQLTQKEMAQLMGVNEKTIYKWETSKKEPILKYQGKLDQVCRENNIYPKYLGDEENYLPLKRINVAIDIIRFIDTNGLVTAGDIAEEFSMSRRNVYRYIKILKMQGLVKIIRGKYGGIVTANYGI